MVVIFHKHHMLYFSVGKYFITNVPGEKSCHTKPEELLSFHCIFQSFEKKNHILFKSMLKICPELIV